MAINSKVTAAIKDDGGYIEEKEETPVAGGDDLQDALEQVDETYDGMIDQVDSFYQEQIDASKQWAKTQQQNQQDQTDFAIEQIEQQKQQAEEDYLKEQSGAYVDWQKQSGQYGVNAEAMAAQGMGGTGYSESAQVSMYNTYQNRVATAREAFARATLNYNNAIKEARLQNNAVLAEIAFQAYQQQLELSLQGFQYKNQLVLEKADRKAAVKREYYNQYLDVLDQINTEAALAEEQRQFDASLAEEKRQFDESLKQTSGFILPNNETDPDDEAPEVQTEYYSGELNADAKIYGTFSNGYQPKGISGHGTLSKTGNYVTLETQTLDGTTKSVRQNIWQAQDGTWWYWEGRQNKYIQLSRKTS